MSEDVKGSIGSSGVGYDVLVDDSLMVSVSVSDSVQSGVMAGSSIALQAKVPLAAILDAAAAASKNSTVIAVEGWLKDLLEKYEAAKAAAAAPVAAQS